ncbi:MAG: hypothetical protein WD451_07895 [Thermoanaerobaculia bacterium]
MATIHQDDGLELFAPTVSGNESVKSAAAGVFAAGFDDEAFTAAPNDSPYLDPVS